MPTSVWRRETIGSLIASGAITAHKDGNYGSLYPRVEEFGDDGVPFLTAKSLDAGRIDVDGAPRLSDSRADSLPFGFVQPDDVLLSHNATIGRVAIVPDFEGRMLVGTSLTYFRLNIERLRPRYFAAFLAGSDFQNQLAAVMSHSTRNQVPITAQRSLSVVVPPLEVQDIVALTLGQLDDKIEQNRRTSRKLEELARGVFKAWFVDFEPVKAKAAGATAFPGMPPAAFAALPERLTNSSLGPVPEGWSVGTLSALAVVAIGGVWGDDKESDGTVQAISLRGVDLEHLRESGSAEPPCRWIKPEALAKRPLLESDVLIAGSGAGPTGRPLWAHPRVLGQWSVPVTYSNFCKRLSCTSAPAACFVDALLYEMRISREIWEHVNGTSIPNLNATSLLQRGLIIPPASLLEAYHAVVAPMMELRYSGESAKLAGLRDYLLPRLLSGQVRINCEKTDLIR